MQALAERIGAWLEGATFEGYEPLGFSGLKTFAPPPEELIGRTLGGVGRRGKYVLMEFGDGVRIAFHLSQAGRVDFEEPLSARNRRMLGKVRPPRPSAPMRRKSRRELPQSVSTA